MASADPVTFGPFELDTRTGELRKGSDVIPLQEKPFRLLTLLIEHDGGIVSREQIRERLWGADTHVEFDDSLNQAVKKLREALGDSLVQPAYIQTLPRRGYRFVCPVKLGLSRARPRSPRFVGREAQLAELRHARDDASSGRGLFLCITGEPGIGKTTLVDRFLAQTAAEGAFHIAIGRCSERFSGTEAYLPILEALQSLLDGDACHAVRRLMIAHAPTWYLQAAPVDAASSSALPDAKAATQERLKRDFYALLDALSRERPVIFFLDDLHWADDATVDLLAYIGPRCATMPVLFLSTYRPSDLLHARHPFRVVRLELRTKRVYREIELPLFGQEDIARYLSLEFDDAVVPDDLSNWLHEHTEGSPLFFVDLISDLRQRGLIRNEDGEIRLDNAVAAGTDTVPDSVRGMVERKLARLDGEDRKLLQAASVQGAAFDSFIVSGVLELTSAAVEERLEALASTHRLVRFHTMATLPGGVVSAGYQFVHALYQSAFYASLAPPRQAALSSTTARVLMDAYGQRHEAIASDLAYLFEVACDWENASSYFLLATEEAARVSLQSKAAALARRAIAAAEHHPDSQPRKLRAAFLLARAHQAMSQFEESVAAFELAERTAAELGDVQSTIEAVCGASVCLFHLRRFTQMGERARCALSAAIAAGWEPGIAYARTVLALERFFIGDLEPMREHLDFAAPILERAGPRLEHAAGIAVSYRGFLHSLQSEYLAADPLFERSLERARSLSLSFEVIRILWMRGLELGNRGLFDHAVRTLEEALRAAEMNGDAYWLPRIPNTLGWIYGEMFDDQTSFRLNTDGVKIAQENHFPEGEANARINLALQHIALGELDHADSHLREGERILNEQNTTIWLRWRFNIRLRGAQAAYWLAKGETARAADSARVSLDLAGKARAHKHVAVARKILGDIAVKEERPRDAVHEYKQAAKVLRESPCPILAWRVLSALANAEPKSRELYTGAAQTVLDFLAGNIRDAHQRRLFHSLAQA